MIPVRLEVFDAPPGPPEADAPGDSALDDLRLASFDTGYRAGWDDANAARAGAETEIEEAISRNLQTLSFSYHDARSHVLRALRPLIGGIAARLLPEIAHSALPGLVADALEPFADLAADAPIEVLACPDTLVRLERRLASDTGLPLTFLPAPSLTAGQVWLRLAETETRVDIDVALTAIRTVLADFFDPNGKDNARG